MDEIQVKYSRGQEELGVGEPQKGKGVQGQRFGKKGSTS